MVVFISLITASCQLPNSSSEEVNLTGKSFLTFESNGGTLIDPIEITFTNPFPFPQPPQKPGVTFLGWYFDQDTLTRPLNLQTLRYVPIPKQVTLYAKWSAWVDGVELFNFPMMHLSLSNPIEWIDQWTYVPASISLTNTSEAFTLHDEPLVMKGRGNGSWGYEKKGYRIKFDQKVSLFGEASSRHWVLAPGGHDFATIRNHLAYSLTNRLLDGIEYTTSSHFVELFVNGNYHGVYNVFEHVRVQESRVDIDSEYGVLDTGYLLEYDAYAEGTSGLDHFWVNGLKYAYAIKSPDPTDYWMNTSQTLYEQQVQFIQDYMQRVTDAILTYDLDTVMELVDLDSVIDMYLLHEFFKNTDTGWSSFYMYKKPGGKLYFGPAWDFDFTSGISRGDASFQGLYVSQDIVYHSDFTASEYYLALMQIPVFVDFVRARYLTLSEQLPFHLEDLFIITQIHHPSFQRDGERWFWLSNWQQEQNMVKAWLRNRHQWFLEWTTTLT
jgi:uncharacterized repeat protein (TIGR02543 family)